MPRRTSFKVSLNLPFGLGGVEQTWEPDDDERRAAWELYVELATRIATVPRQPGTGLAREALNSLHTSSEQPGGSFAATDRASPSQKATDPHRSARSRSPSSTTPSDHYSRPGTHSYRTTRTSDHPR